MLSKTPLSLPLLAAGFFLASCLPSAFAAGPVPGDYDGNGLSDLAVVDVARTARTTAWHVRLNDGQVISYGFGVPGDALTPGNFSGENKIQPGVVFVRDIALRLEWHLNTPSGVILRRFGTPGDTPVVADYDCDGKTDRAVRTPSGKYSYWDIAFANGAAANNILFGLSGDKVFGADADGDGCDEMFNVRLQNKKIYFIYRKWNNATPAVVQWGEAGDIPLKPMDMNGDGKPDFMVVRTVNNKQVVIVRYSAASGETIFLNAPEGTVVLTGNFTGVNGFAWWDLRAAKFYIKDGSGTPAEVSLGSSTSALVRPDGSVVQPGENERLGTSSTGGGDSGGSLSCDKNLSGRDGSGGFTYNPQNSRNTMKVILPNTYTNRTREVQAASNGEIFETLYRAVPNEWGNRQRYYGRKSLGSYPRTVHLVISTTSGERHCVKIDNTRSRQD